MILFGYTLLFFALLGTSIATRPPFKPEPASRGWVYYSPIPELKGKTYAVLLLKVPTGEGDIIGVEIAEGMDWLKAEGKQKELASGHFDGGTKLSLPLGENVYINVSVPRKLNPKWVRLAEKRLTAKVSDKYLQVLEQKLKDNSGYVPHVPPKEPPTGPRKWREEQERLRGQGSGMKRRSQYKYW
ncbi:hypothetical protein F5887DRAFT_1021054 [Amanita rubescens]|nr:hypothetical protein F5887DRAFT_1021054 [Amanita rubescens]